jgi:hypothetical protein
MVKIVKHPGNGRLNNLNYPVLNVLSSLTEMAMCPMTGINKGQGFYSSQLTFLSSQYYSRICSIPMVILVDVTNRLRFYVYR